MIDVALRHLGDEIALDFVTALPVDESIRCLKRNIRRLKGQRIFVRQEDKRLLIESGWHAGNANEPPGLWLCRFEGELTPVSVGTRVHGRVVRNGRLELLLTLPGLITSVFAVLGIALNVLFVAALSAMMLALFMAYYVYFQKLLGRQARELSQWVFASLTVPEGRASGSLS